MPARDEGPTALQQTTGIETPTPVSPASQDITQNMSSLSGVSSTDMIMTATPSSTGMPPVVVTSTQIDGSPSSMIGTAGTTAASNTSPNVGASTTNTAQSETESQGTLTQDTSPSDIAKLTEQVWEHENERVKRWRNEINSLLTFAGLFAAVITGFAVQYYTIIQPPPDLSVPVLLQILQQLSELTNHTAEELNSPLQGILAQQALQSSPPSLGDVSVYIAALWFASLVCGLGAASIAISVNQWLNNLLTPTALSGNGSHEQLRIWNLRHQTFRNWRLAVFIDIPSALLQIALVLFLVGLVGYLWLLDHRVAFPTLVLVLLLLSFLLVTTFTPVFAAYSPFISPQSKFLCWLWLIVRLLQCKTIIRFFDWLWDVAIDHDLQFISYGGTLKLYRQAQSRLTILRAIRGYGYYSWAAGESVYLRTKAGHASDKTMVANMLPVIKDDDNSLSFITSFLDVMRPDLALSNIVTMCQRRPPNLPDTEGTPWQRDAQLSNKFISMCVRYAARFVPDRPNTVDAHGAVTLQEQALNVYAVALDTLRSDQEGSRAVHLQLFKCLEQGTVRTPSTQMEILKLIRDHHDEADTKNWTKDDIQHVTNVQKWSYSASTSPAVAMSYTAVALKIFEELEQPECPRWPHVKNTLGALETYLAKHPNTENTTDAQKCEAWALDGWWDRSLKRSMRAIAALADASYSTQEDAQIVGEILDLMKNVLGLIKNQIGPDLFENDDMFWASLTFQDVMSMVERIRRRPAAIPVPAERISPGHQLLERIGINNRRLSPRHGNYVDQRKQSDPEKDPGDAQKEAQNQGTPSQYAVTAIVRSSDSIPGAGTEKPDADAPTDIIVSSL